MNVNIHVVIFLSAKQVTHRSVLYQKYIKGEHFCRPSEDSAVSMKITTSKFPLHINGVPELPNTHFSEHWNKGGQLILFDYYSVLEEKNSKL